MINQIDHRKPCKDHKGNHYDSIMELAAAYNMQPETLSRRVNVYGWSMQKTLTTPVKKNGGQICYDHNGKRFRSVTRMCKYWSIDRKTFIYRVNHGWSIEDALTKTTGTKKELIES